MNTVKSCDIKKMSVLIKSINQPVYTIGVGKSSHIARLFSDQLKFLSINSSNLDCTNLLHGDIGILQPGDLVILISKSGSTGELVNIVPEIKKKQCRTCIVTMRGESILAEMVDFVFVLDRVEEIDIHNLMPTNSLIVFMNFFNKVLANIIDEKNLNTTQMVLANHVGGHLGNYVTKYTSTTSNCKAKLGTIESDVSGFLGNFRQEKFRAEFIFNKFVQLDFTSVLDVGAGALKHTKAFIEHGKTVDISDYGSSVYFKEHETETLAVISNKFIGDFNEIDFGKTYDAVWCSHILEHQLNVNSFLRKIHSLLNEDGYLAIIVPPRKPFIVGGHATLWNAGLVLYNLVLAGFDCSYECHIHQYDYNIGVIIRKRTIHALPSELSMDKGDIELLSKYFPFDARHNFNGDIMKMSTTSEDFWNK